MLSSLIGVVGGTSQANYAAGSTFQDAFARWRRSQGLAAVSIDLGAIEVVGFVAENEGVRERLAKIGMEPIAAERAMRLIESAMRNPLRPIKSTQVITGIRAYYEAEEVAWKRDRRFWSLRRHSALESGNGPANKTTAASLIKDRIASAKSWDEVVGFCVDALANKVSEMFAVPVEQVDVTLSMASYGVDSLVAVEVRNWLSATARAELSTFDIMQSPSLASLATKAAEKSQYAAQTGLKAP